MIYISYSSPLYRFFDAIFRRFWLLTALVLLCFGVSVLAVSFMLKGYTASKVLLVTEPRVGMIVQGTPKSNSRPGDQTEGLDALIHSRTLLEEAAQRAGIDLGRTPRERSQTILKLRRGLKAEVDTETSFIVSLRWKSRREAEQMVDAVVDLYIRYMAQAQSAEAIAAAAFLEGHLAEYQQKMQLAEQRRREFREQNLENMPEMQTNYIGKLRDLDQQLVDVRVQQEEAGMRLAQTKHRIQGVPAMIEAERTSGQDPMEDELNRLRSEEVRLLGQFTPEHPQVKAVRDQIKAVEAHLSRRDSDVTERKMMTNPTYTMLDQQLQEAEINLKTLNERRAALAGALGQYETRVRAIPLQEQRLAGLDRDYTVYQTAFEDITKKLASARIEKELTVRRHQDRYLALDSAEALPTLTPVKRVVLLGFGPLFGLLIGVMVILILEQWDRSFRSVHDLQTALGKPVLAAVPHTPGMEQLTAGLSALVSGDDEDDHREPPGLSSGEAN